MESSDQVDIFTRLGMSSASNEDKQAITAQLTELTLERLMSKAEEQMSSEDMAYLEGLIDSGVADKVEPAMRDKLPNFDQLLTDAAREVEDQLVQDQQTVMAAARRQ